MNHVISVALAICSCLLAIAAAQAITRAATTEGAVVWAGMAIAFALIAAVDLWMAFRKWSER